MSEVGCRLSKKTPLFYGSFSKEKSISTVLYGIIKQCRWKQIGKCKWIICERFIQWYRDFAGQMAVAKLAKTFLTFYRIRRLVAILKVKQSYLLNRPWRPTGL
jgi:hypothetical protein